MVNCILIDDDSDIVDVLSELLRTMDVDILATGNNGKDAVELYKKFKPDLVLTDLQMPRYDGYYAVENIKDVDSKAKFIMITADLDVCNSNLLNLLNIPILHKPFDTNKIKQTIDDVFSQENEFPTSFQIQYKFKDDINFYTCTVNYPQYRNFKQLPVIEECEISNQENTKLSYEKMQNAINLATQNNITHIRKLSEVVSND
ncbi:MAG: response regulator [Candidatus Nitrosopumilus sp. bin_7KS]